MKGKNGKRIEVGDLVKCGGIWGHVGIVSATGRAWWVLKGHYDVANCIVSGSDIVILKKGVVPKAYRKYLKGRIQK